MSAFIYHPKGSMCGACKLRNNDCSDMQFNKMTPMKKYRDANGQNTFIVVRCTSFNKLN